MNFTHWLQKEEAGRTLYHVTRTSNVPGIQQKGIIGYQPSNWVQAASKERYGGGEIFAFDHMKDAARWAAKMDWEFYKGMGTGKISIISFQEDDQWDRDVADPLAQVDRAGQWLKRTRSVAPDHITGVQPFTKEMLGLLRN